MVALSNTEFILILWVTQVGSMVKSTCQARDTNSIPGLEDPLKKEMATHSSILAQRIPCTEHPGRLHSMVIKESATTQRLNNSSSSSTPWKLEASVCHGHILSHSFVSVSLRAYGMQPSRHLCPWNSPDKKTRVDCPFPSPGDLPNHGIEARSHSLQADS